MSIILKGVDLPNSGQIELIIRPHGKVLSNTRGIYTEAIQIPTPHGRLIDAYDVPFGYSIENAPTILEAEGE